MTTPMIPTRLPVLASRSTPVPPPSDAPLRRLVLVTAGIGLGLGALWAAPKDAAYAAPSRLAFAAGFLGLASAGLPVVVALTRRWRRAARAACYRGAPVALQDTLVFIQTEADHAWRGLQAVAGVGLAGLGVWVLAHWPQCAVLLPLRAAAGGLAAATPFLAAATLYGRRRHWFNLAWLKRTLKEQAQHALTQGVPVMREARKPTGLVAPAGPDAFLAGDMLWLLDDFYKNCIVFGQTGSGKTVCILNAVLEGVFVATAGSRLPISGLILDPKGAYHRPIQELCARLGRASDLVIIDPDAWTAHGRTPLSAALNFLDTDQAPKELATQLIEAKKMLGLKSSESFFLDMANTTLTHAITILRAAFPHSPPSLIDVRALIVDAILQTNADGDGAAAAPARANFYDECGELIAIHHPHALLMPPDLLGAIGFFENELQPMNNRQRDGIISTITQIIDEFTLDPIAAIISGPSTIRLDAAIDQGKIVYVHVPSDRRPRLSQLLNGLIKLQYQNAILQRAGKERPSFFFCDEFQVYLSSDKHKGDAAFFERSRESRHANIMATQNISALYRNSSNRDETKTLLSNCSVKIFLRNTEPDMNKWSSEIFGDVSMISVTPSEVAAIGGSFKRFHTTFSRQTRTARAVPPEAFTTLAVPVRGDAARQYAESLVHLASRGETQRLTVTWGVHPL